MFHLGKKEKKMKRFVSNAAYSGNLKLFTQIPDELCQKSFRIFKCQTTKLQTL